MTLATPSDIQDRLGRELTADEDVRVEMLLVDVSAMVVSYCGQDFERIERTTVLWSLDCNQFTLPGLNIDTVSAVIDGQAVTVSQIGPARWRLGVAGEWGGCGLFEGSPLTVTFTSGPDVVPEPIVAVVCSIVCRALGVTPEAAGIQAETTGPFTVQYGSVGAAGPVGLMAGEREVLDRYRRQPVGSITVRPWAS